METVTFYSYKGGVGRTLVVANVAKYLAQFGLKVVVLDFDLEAPGLHHKFALDGSEVKHPRGVVDYIARYREGGTPPVNLSDYTVFVEPPPGGPEPIVLIPAGDAPSPGYWGRLASIDWHALLYAPRAAGVALFEDLKARIASELEPDYLLIDARTGITEMGGIATSLLADVVVTLSLTSSEHLEGVRSVLRTINRTRRLNGDAPVRLEVALSRLPEMDDEDARRATKNAVDFLNQPAADPEDSLSLDEVLILHTDPSIERREHLVIGSEVRGDAEGALLADYLRLFTRFIPLASLAPHVKELVDKAMGRLLEDPLSTERSLEVLARYTGHPEALRALIRFYRVRQDNARMIRACARLWEITREEDLDLIWTALTEGLEVTWRYEERDYPLNFVKEVWTAAGGHDAHVGLRLAQNLDNFGREEEAVQVARQLFDRHPEDEVLAEAVLQHLYSAGEHGEAARFAETRADDFAYDPDYVTLWARAVAELRDRTAATRFIEDPRVDLEDLGSAAPSTLIKLLRVAGRSSEGGDLLDRALEEASRVRDWDGLFEIAEEFARRGPSGQRYFESVVRRRAPDSADAFLADVRAQLRGWGARQRESLSRTA